MIERLDGYDGWALSTSAAALPAVLALCPSGMRVAAWHRGERPSRSRWPLHAWEPVIYGGGRQLIRDGLQTRRVDSIVCGVAAVTTLPGRVIGAKAAAVCRWIFGLLGAQPGDSLDDLFPGSGAVGQAWAAFTGCPGPSHQARTYASSLGPPRRVAPDVEHDGYPPDRRGHNRVRTGLPPCPGGRQRAAFPRPPAPTPIPQRSFTHA